MCKNKYQCSWPFTLYSKQETGMQSTSGCENMTPCRQNVPEDHSYVSSPPPLVAPIVEPATRSSSPCGLGCEIAALAERQQMVGESSDHNHNVNVSSYNMLPGSF